MESESVMNEQFAGIMVHGRLSLDILSKKNIVSIELGLSERQPLSSTGGTRKIQVLLCT